MAKTAPKISQIVKDYTKELAKAHIRPKKIILFGSHAAGTAGVWSDIDLSVISDDFEGKGILERQQILGRANQNLQAPLDLIGYTSREIDQCETGTLLYEILKTGLEIPLK